jgi:hypothetical protein
MDLTAEFLIYATLFRLAIIGAGVFAIVLGYKLFVRGVMPDGRTEGELHAGEIRLTVKNAAPGTCFALFGATMVSVMLIQGNPELLFDRTAADGGAEHITLRGEEPLPAPATAMNCGGFCQYIGGILQGSQDVDGAISQQAKALRPDESLADAAKPLSHLAALYLAEPGRIDTKLAGKALALTEVVNQVAPRDADNLATMAWAEWYLGDRDRAQRAMARAADADARYAPDLDAMRNNLR